VETISCIFCGEGDSRALIQENGFTGRKCARCGLIYISPRPSPEEIANLYGHDEANVSAEAQIAAEPYKRLQARNTLRILRKFVSGGKLLEIGPGAGYFMDEARIAGFSPYGIELNHLQADSIRDKLSLPCESRSISDAFLGEQFDVIYHCDVISHLSDPIAEFRAMRQRLTENGVLIFETGNMGDVRADRLQQIRLFQYPDHLFFFSTRNIESLLQLANFHMLGIARHSIVPEMWMNKALSGLRGDGTSANAHANGNGAKKRPTSAAAAQLRFSIRYRLGGLTPIQDHHQTIVVVAKGS
jgi:SAM-dependent methyltransferase